MIRDSEKPGLGDDHRLDQRLLFVAAALQVLPVRIGRQTIQGQAALAHGTLDDGLSYRGNVEADTLF